MTKKWVPTSKKRRRPNRTASAPTALAALLRQVDPHARVFVETERQVAAEILSADDKPERVLEAGKNALAFGEEVRRRRLQVMQPSESVACHEGCHWCCYLKVDATVPEVLVIADYIRKAVQPDEAQLISARAEALAQDPRIFSRDAKVEARIPCPLLTDDHRCAAYEARPLACRGWNSLDSESCRLALDDERAQGLTNMDLVQECDAVGVGLRVALSEAGLAGGEIVELTAGLHIALSEPNALQRWTAGEPLFAAARTDRFGGEA